MTANKATKLIGQRILSEANDLKRTIETVSKDLSISLDKLNALIDGNLEMSEAVEIVQSFSKVYPVRVADILLDSVDISDKVIFMKKNESLASSRVYSRLNKEGRSSEYYEYRDTATSKLSPFRPEWIKELRVVSDNDPYNPDVAYNNGHLMHQMTTFVGPVNFYWEVNGKKYCQEMNTGDSNFITPFWKHSFTSRDSSKEAYIVAVTFSGDVGRARNELYALGQEAINNFSFDNSDINIAISQLIRQIMNNQMLDKESFKVILERNQLKIDVDNLLDETEVKDPNCLRAICKLFNLPEDIFNLPVNKFEDEVIVKTHQSRESYIFNTSNQDYEINQLANNSRMPECVGFNMKILSKNMTQSSQLKSSLHSFIYNYGDNPVNFSWCSEEKWHLNIVEPGDSVYVSPQVAHKMWSEISSSGSLFMFRVPGFINLKVQKELSSFAFKDRIIENSPWFN